MEYTWQVRTHIHFSVDTMEVQTKIENLTAYISEETDRELNKFYLASICDDKLDELISETSDYNRDTLLKNVAKIYPGIKIEDA